MAHTHTKDRSEIKQKITSEGTWTTITWKCSCGETASVEEDFRPNK